MKLRLLTAIMLIAWTAIGTSCPIDSGTNQTQPTVSIVIGYAITSQQTGQYWADFPGISYGAQNFQNSPQVLNPLQQQNPSAATNNNSAAPKVSSTGSF
ncbi:hypothetical protein HYX58_04135 [Candidatus Dependentiae bacterium]|nr:hypothetical protein [Candidatus Dependentiae bacterium]